MKRACGLAVALWALLVAPFAATAERLEVPPYVLSAYADAPADEVSAAWVSSQYLLERRYEEAIEVLRELEKKKPRSLLPTMGIMFTHHVRMLENFDFHYLRDFREAEQQNIRLMDQVFHRKAASRWEMLMAGGSLGMRGMIQARQQNYLRAATLGLEALGILRDIRFEGEGLPPLYDVLYGIGMYNYWMSWAQQRSLILAFLPDRTQEGFRDLALCAEKAPLSGAIAGFALGYLYGQEGRVKEALARVGPLVDAYPKNIIFRSLWGRLLIAGGRIDEGLVVLDAILKEEPRIIYLGFHLAKPLYLRHRESERVEKLLEAFLTEPNVKRLNPARSEAHLMLADLSMLRGDWAKAKEHFRNVDASSLAGAWQPKVQELKRKLRKA